MPSLNGLSGSLWEGFGAASDPAMASTFWMAVATFCYTEAGVELKYFVILSLHMYYVYINTSNLYTHIFFCFLNKCISVLSRFKQTGVSFRSADLDPGINPSNCAVGPRVCWTVRAPSLPWRRWQVLRIAMATCPWHDKTWHLGIL